jgi:hypothetical protein
MFQQEEGSINLKSIETVDFVNTIKIVAVKNALTFKQCKKIYNKHSVESSFMKKFMKEAFFCHKSGIQDLINCEKFLLFNLLYTGGTNEEKADILFSLLEDDGSMLIQNHSEQLVETLTNLLYIPTVMMGNMVSYYSDFQSDYSKCEFDKLFKLFTTNKDIVNDFALNIVG